VIDPMTEPSIQAIHDELRALATPVAETLRSAHYGVERPVFGLRHKADDCEMNIIIYSHTGAGGMQDALIQFNGEGNCLIFVGPLYDAPRPEDRPAATQVGLIPSLPLRRTIPSSTPDLATVLLREVRQLMLDHG
jgi:hypothetical protein